MLIMLAALSLLVWMMSTYSEWCVGVRYDSRDGVRKATATEKAYGRRLKAQS